MNPVTKFMIAALAAIILVIASAMMDGPSETQAAQDVADEAAYAAALADGGASHCAALGRTQELGLQPITFIWCAHVGGAGKRARAAQAHLRWRLEPTFQRARQGRMDGFGARTVARP